MKLTEKEFSDFITMICKADDDQLEYAKSLADVPAKTRTLMVDVIKRQVESAMKNVLKNTKSEKPVMKIEKPVKKREIERTASGRAKEIRKPRKFEIKLIHGMSYVEQIPFSFERFSKFLQKQNLKAYGNYVRGMKRLLKESNVTVFSSTGSLNKISLSDLEPARDFIGKNHSMYASTKRGWFRKFNDYLIYEYSLNKK
jgi:hypothetical protein